jgi:hypothetical protein
MAKNFLVSIDLNGNELLQGVLQNLGVDPTALGAGQVYYNTGTNKIRWYDGTAWREISYINDAGTGTGDLWSASQIQNAIDTAVSSAVNYKGGLDASGPVVPDLNTITSTIGDMYTVTAAGTITFTTGSLSLEVGDVVIAESSGVLNDASDWTVVEKNLDGALQAANNLSDVQSAATSFNNIKQDATETATGVSEIATQAEVDAGTDDARYVTPLKLAGWYTSQAITSKFAVDLDGAGEATVTRLFAGGVTTFSVTHSLNTTDTVVQIKEIASGEEVIADVDNTAANTLDIIFNGSIADDVYRVTIIG